VIALLIAALLLASPAAQAAKGGTRKPKHPAPSHRVVPEQDPKLGGAAKAFARATVAFTTPEERAVVERDAVEVQLKISHYALGGGAHAHVIFDNEPALQIDDVEHPIVLKDVPPGPHVLRAVLCRPWHEVVKAKGAFAMVRFWAGPRFVGRAAELAERAEWPDPKKPLLTYVLPIGERPEGEEGTVPEVSGASEPEDAPPPPAARKKPAAPALDFYLSNARLGGRAHKVRVVLDKSELPLVRAWEPRRFARLKPGEHRLTIDLLNGKGEKVANALNRTDRTFVTK
jgi:hypothetical protein